MEFLKDLIVLVLVCHFDLIASYHKLPSTRVPTYRAGGNYVSPQYLVYRRPQALLRPRQYYNARTSRNGDSKQNVVVHKTPLTEPMDVCLGVNAVFAHDSHEKDLCSVQPINKEKSKSSLFKKFRTSLSYFDKEFFNVSKHFK